MNVDEPVEIELDDAWPARRFDSLGELDSLYSDWRDEVCNRRRHASCQTPGQAI